MASNLAQGLVKGSAVPPAEQISLDGSNRGISTQLLVLMESSQPSQSLTRHLAMNSRAVEASTRANFDFSHQDTPTSTSRVSRAAMA